MTSNRIKNIGLLLDVLTISCVCALVYLAVTGQISEAFDNIRGLIDSDSVCESDPKIDEIAGKIEYMFDVMDGKWVDNLSVLNDKKRNIHEKCKLCKSNESYTIDKKDIFLCLYDEKGAYYEDHMLMHVSLHEMAHVICHEIGHTKLFNTIFEELMVVAHKCNIYDQYYKPINDYCGVDETY